MSPAEMKALFRGRRPWNHFMLAAMLLFGASTAFAQPPVLLTQPTPVLAGQPFEATLRIVDVWRVGVEKQPTIEIVGNTIRIPFNTLCPFLCPPTQAVREYPFQMPALPAGSYTVVFHDLVGNPAPVVAEVSLFALMVGWRQLHRLSS